MPAYVIDFLSDAGPERRRFTLDDDRPLRGQLHHVLAELERAHVVLQGGPTDELAVYWSGRELDLEQPLAALGVTAERPLELRMQRRRPSVTLPAPPPEAPAERFVPKSVGAAAALGAVGGAAAWAIGALFGDVVPPAGRLIATDLRADVFSASSWAVTVGAVAAWAHARRVGASAAAGALLGAAAGLAAAAAWTLARAYLPEPAAPGTAVAWQVLLWALLATLTSAALSAAARARAVRATAAADPNAAPPAPGAGASLLRAAAWAAPAGLAAGLLATLPGEPALWQGLAAVLAGAGAAGAAAWGAAHAARAVLELERRPATADARGPGVGAATLREWPLADGAVAYLGRAPGTGDHAPALTLAAGRALFYADTAAGADAAPRELRNGDRVDVGAARYRFRRRAA